MTLNYLASKFEDDFRTLINDTIVGNTGIWNYYSPIKMNGIIATGWLGNDDIFIINCDGIFSFDIIKKEINHQDYVSSFQKNISKDNLTYFFEIKNEVVNIFGLRGGGGNLLTADNTWKLDLIPISWNVKVPKLINYKSRTANFLELQQNQYQGYLYLGFSKSENYFMIMGDQGIDIYKRIE